MIDPSRKPTQMLLQHLEQFQARIGRIWAEPVRSRQDLTEVIPADPVFEQGRSHRPRGCRRRNLGATGFPPTVDVTAGSRWTATRVRGLRSIFRAVGEAASQGRDRRESDFKSPHVPQSHHAFGSDEARCGITPPAKRNVSGGWFPLEFDPGGLSRPNPPRGLRRPVRIRASPE